ncbi:MAG: hypothetical protein JO266_12425 [Acidobacteria bacterium]|nr:hypothetical protein [Acidobacteriota bacterium]
MSDPLHARTPVIIVFHIGSSTLRSQAEMLDPVWATRGYLQPFRFTALAGQQEQQLKQELESPLRSARRRRSLSLQWELEAP